MAFVAYQFLVLAKWMAAMRWDKWTPKATDIIVVPFLSEVNHFLACTWDVDENQTVMEFWRQRCSDCPILSEMANIYLAVSPGSVPVESMFSTAGYMLNSKRSSMAPYMYKLDMVLFIHDNYDVVCSQAFWDSVHNRSLSKFTAEIMFHICSYIKAKEWRQRWLTEHHHDALNVHEKRVGCRCIMWNVQEEARVCKQKDSAALVCTDGKRPDDLALDPMAGSESNYDLQ